MLGGSAHRSLQNLPWWKHWDYTAVKTDWTDHGDGQSTEIVAFDEMLRTVHFSNTIACFTGCALCWSMRKVHLQMLQLIVGINVLQTALNYMQLTHSDTGMP